MQSVYAVHYHEIALKGKNRPDFLRKLAENICAAAGLGKNEVKVVSGRLIVHPLPRHLPAGRGGSHLNPLPMMGEGRVRAALAHTFGISSFSPALLTDAEYGEIEKAVRAVISGGRASPTAVGEARPLAFDTFAIRATRGDKAFSMTSKEVEIKLGDFVREKFHKKVDLENPDITFHAEIFPGGAVIYTDKISGPGGLPVGSEAKAMVLLSGGIDSPVAAARVMKRGMPISLIHFHSYPFSTRASIDKVRQIAEILFGSHGGRPIRFYAIPLAEAQKVIVKKCAERYRVLLYRRMMLRIAESIGKTAGARALVTGESIGQVASQTVENLAAVEAIASMPILRPLIGFDKQEIIDEAKRLGTYEISIQPHQDCCSLFMPKKVATRASVEDLDKEEEKLNIDELISHAIRHSERNEVQ